MFVTDWFAETIYAGVPTAAPSTPARARFEAGVRAGNLALLAAGAVSGLFGLALPALLRAGLASRRRDCHFADIPFPSILKNLLKGEGGAIKSAERQVSPTA